jgi:hypothetical protein
VLDFKQLFLTANESLIMCVDPSFNFYKYENNFNTIIDDSVIKLKQEVGQTVIDLEINDQYIFVVCNTKKLKIFTIDKSDLVKELDITGNQIKLVSASHFILFDSTTRLIQLYDQCASFSRLHEVDLAEKIDTGFNIAHDRTKYLTFFNRNMIKSTISK